jgi:NAD(P)H dehydrogenase (quinone)
MVRTDVARAAAELLLESWKGNRVVELEGPTRISPNDIAACYAHLLGRAVSPKAVPRDTWDRLRQVVGVRRSLGAMSVPAFIR